MKPPFRTLAVSLVALPLIALTCGGGGPSPQDPTPNAPRARLRLSGYLEGRLEPCGCASGQMGGLARRAFALLQDRAYDVLIEGGHMAVQGGPLDVQKVYTLLQVLDRTKARYHALGLGSVDLELPTEDLQDFLGGFTVPSVASDLVPKREGSAWPMLPFVEHRIDNGGATVRIASFVTELPGGDAGRAAAEDLRLLEPSAAWQRALHGAAPGTLRVLMVHAADDTVREMAKLEPRPDLLIAVNRSKTEPPRDPEIVDGVPIVWPGIRGRFLLDVTIARIDGQPKVVDYRPIALTGSKTAKGAMEDKDVVAIVLEHRNLVKELGIREEVADRLPTRDGASYVGSADCKRCHVSAFRAWDESDHSYAWETLVDARESGRYNWPVTHYPDCIACHTVGYGEKSGFINPEKTPGLKGVGCEACHGPGSRHSAEPDKFELGKIDPATCRICHDFEQTPDFDYQERWKQIEHGIDDNGKGGGAKKYGR